MLKPCDRNIRRTIQLTRAMMRLADRGDADREDTGCGVLYGILRDSAYKLRRLAEEEKQKHLNKRSKPASPESYLTEDPNRTLNAEQGGKMVASLKGTQTEMNLLASFAGESQARNRYTFFAGKARKEGFVQIADIFEETANQEKEHAKRFFNFLEGGEIQIVGSFPAGVIGSTLDNLRASADGEKHEHAEMYPGFAAIARREGFEAIAMVWEAIAVAERQHEKRYRDLAANIAEGRVFQRAGKVLWRCRNCGYLHESAEAPQMCPACAHPQAHFELLGENW
jgi:rubrerythrin